jgi:hypothetical protein
MHALIINGVLDDLRGAHLTLIAVRNSLAANPAVPA